MKSNHTFIITSLCIFLLRVIDLATTYYATIDFKTQEKNLLVIIFNLNIVEFFFLEIISAFGLIALYLYSEKYYLEFNIKASSLKSYLTLFFFEKGKINLSDLVFKVKFKRIAILFGSIVPMFIIPTSIVFILNNLWVNAVISRHDAAFKYYHILNDYYFFEGIIFGFPPIYLIYLICKRLNGKYVKNRISMSYNININESNIKKSKILKALYFLPLLGIINNWLEYKNIKTFMTDFLKGISGH